MTDRIELADLVSSLRSEIDRAWSEGQYDVVGFEAGPIEVELTTAVEVIQGKGTVTAKFTVGRVASHLTAGGPGMMPWLYFIRRILLGAWFIQEVRN